MLVKMNISTAMQYTKLPAGRCGHSAAHVILFAVFQI